MIKRRGLAILLLIMALMSLGCTPEKSPATPPTEGIAVGEPNPAAPDPAGSTSPKISEDAAKAMELEKSIGDIKSISLEDLEGNKVDRRFSELEIKDIQKAFNESFIMDTAYIEMIAGNTMTIELEDGNSVRIHSYGDPNYIVATIGEQTYHLGCPLIGEILLEQAE